jgi:hypothetical protein
MHHSYFRIQNEAAEMDECEEEILEPAQCSQQSLKETTSLAASPQHGAIKSYKCQLCNEIFLSVHQLFSHELRDHEHIGTSQINHIKKQLPKYNQHEKVFSSINDVSEAKMHDTNPWTDDSFTENSQKQDGNLQTDASNLGKCTSSIGGELQGQDGNQKTHISNMEGKSQKQDGNQQTHISNMEGKSQEQDGNQHTHTSAMEGKSQKEDGNQQAHASDMEEKSQKQDGNEQMHTSRMEEIKSDQNPHLQCEEPFASDNQHSKCELRYCDKETASVQQGEGHFESNFSEEETTFEVTGLTEPTTSSECEIVSLPYKCVTCDERFQTRCRLFYHDLEVHVGITKPATLQSRDVSLESSQKKVKEKKALNEVIRKRTAESVLEEQQPMKVIITEEESTIEEVKEKHEESELRKVSFKKASAGNKLNQKFIVKQRIVQGDGKEIKINSENLEHIKETLEAITAKYPWNETLIGTGVGSEADEHNTERQPKTFVIIKDDSQTEGGNQKTTGGYRIDVVTNYVLSQSQIKQLLHE